MVEGGDASNAESRVWARLPSTVGETLVRGLSGSDLQTLLLSVARQRAARVRPADLLRRWERDRFVRPAGIDPRALVQLEARLWQLLPDDVEGVELSPVAPLGASSALGTVSQNKVVTTMRLSEVLSDSTNVLAIEAAHRRRAVAVDERAVQQVHLAASHRQLRAQALGPNLGAHFGLFAVVSSARDRGSGRTDAHLLVKHVRYWQRVLAAVVPAASPQVRFTIFDAPVVRERLTDTVLPALGAGGGPVPLLEEPERERGRGYYTSAALRLTIREGDREVEIGDGGFTSWTAQLVGDAKERCLISCVSTDRLAQLSGPTSNR